MYFGKTWDSPRTNGDNLRSGHWPGFTMRGLVQWRTAFETTEGEYELCRAILVSAACRTHHAHVDGIDFRIALRSYLLGINATSHSQELTATGLVNMCFAFGATLMDIYEWNRAEDLLELAHDRQCKITNGSIAAETQIAIELSLLYVFANGMLYTDSSLYDRYKKKLRLHIPTHRRLDQQPGFRLYTFARMYSLNFEQFGVYRLCRELKASLPQLTGAATSYTAAKSSIQALWCEVLELFKEREQKLQDARKALGHQHPAVVELVSSIARVYSLLRQFQHEKRHLEALLRCQQQRHGHQLDNTLQTVERLALCRLGLKDSENALDSM